MKKHFCHAQLTGQLITLALLLGCCSTSFATIWTTRTKGDIANLYNWTNGSSTPVSFLTPGDTWVIADTMTIGSITWTLGTMSSAGVTVNFAAGGMLQDTLPGAGTTINIYGNVITNGAPLTITGAGAHVFFNIYGNTIFDLSSFSGSNDNVHLTINSHGTFTMTGGSIGTTGNNTITTVNFFGNTSLSGPGAMWSMGSGSTGSVHFALPSSSGTMLIDNSSTGAWSNIDVFVDSGCTAKLDGNFTTSTGTAANGLTVKGRLICPAVDSVNGTNSFNLISGGALIVAHATGLDGAIVSTGTNSFGAAATYIFNGIVPQVTGLNMPAALFNPDTIGVDNPAGVTISQSTFTTGYVKLNNGLLHTSINSLTVPGDVGRIIGAGPTRYVIGTLAKTIAGDTAVTFEIGDSTYVPLALKFDSIGTGGSIAASVAYGLHPSAGSSALDLTRMINHYWTVTNNAPTGPSKVKVKASYSLTDILGGSNSFFSTQQYSGSLWLTTPIPDTNTSAPYSSMTDSAIALGALPGDYIIGRRAGTLAAGIDVGENFKLNVYPNPAVGAFSFVISGKGNEDAEVTITDVAGRCLAKQPVRTNISVIVPFSGPSGVYFVTATVNGKSISQRIILE